MELRDGSLVNDRFGTWSVTGVIAGRAECEPIITNNRRAVGDFLIGKVADGCE